MTEIEFLMVEGVVVRGHRVASGKGGDTRFPRGTIRRQLPFFEAAIPDLDDWLGGAPHPGTINLDFGSRRIEIGAPEYVLQQVHWTDFFPPENFFLSRAFLAVAKHRYPVMLYLPDPATKPDHHQAGSVVELLAAFIPALAYGDRVTLGCSSRAVLIR